MGFTVYYRSTEPLEADKADQVRFALRTANEGRTWLSCEPVHMFLTQMDGHLLGGSKPNFTPHPDDVASAKTEGLPDGTIMDVLSILCDISEEHGVDWEFSHDHDPGPIGCIREGIPEPRLIEELRSIAALGNVLADLESEFLQGLNGGEGLGDDSSHFGDDDDNDPPILKLFPGDS